MKNAIIEAYLAVAEGCSTDFLIACPQKNAQFIAKCKSLGMNESAYELNRKLLNLRKRGALADIKCKRVHIDGAEDCQFAAEVAVRFIECRDSIASTDALFCNPEKAAEFDEIAAEITPGFLPECYRWAALKLRKTRKLQPELVSRVLPATKVLRFVVEEVGEEQIPIEQGLYMFSSGKELLYVGEAENLRARLKKHLCHSDNRWLARWFWENEIKNEMAFLEIHVLPENTSSKARKALEASLIASRRPIFNVKLLPT